MTNTKHTPGPWNAVEDDGFTNMMVIGDTRYVAEAMGINTKQMQANAHLIASAPELLEALNAAVPILEWCMRNYPDAYDSHKRDVLVFARKALTKTQGE